MNILILEPTDYSQDAVELYLSIGKLLPPVSNIKELIEGLPDADVLVVRLAYTLDSKILEAATRLKCIVTPTTGLNHIDQDFCHENGITIISLKGQLELLRTITPTAELTWGLLLSLIRKIPASFNSVLDGAWDRDQFLGTELKGKTLGVIGLGRLGSMVASFGVAFGMEVLFFDVDDKIELNPGVRSVQLNELLRRSDVISLHIPLDAKTTNFFDSEKISKMKKGSILINTSRGEVLSEESLLIALESGDLSGAALDVLQGEVSGGANWAESCRLIQYARRNNNLLITPHIGGACPDSMRKTELFCAKLFVENFENESEHH